MPVKNRGYLPLFLSCPQASPAVTAAEFDTDPGELLGRHWRDWVTFGREQGLEGAAEETGIAPARNCGGTTHATGTPPATSLDMAVPRTVGVL